MQCDATQEVAGRASRLSLFAGLHLFRIFPGTTTSRPDWVALRSPAKQLIYRRVDFFADLDFAAGLDSDFFAAGFLAAVFLPEVFFAEVFLAVVFFVVFLRAPALAVSDLTALPTGTLLTCFAADFAAATASFGSADLPCSTRLPITAPARPPTIAPAGPAITLPATAPVTAPAACLVSGTLELGFDSFAMEAVYMRCPVLDEVCALLWLTDGRNAGVLDQSRDRFYGGGDC
jgi:hypothetical protein